jgi:hypothetical protein
MSVIIGIIILGITGLGTFLCVIMLIHDMWVYRKARDWRIDIQALQMENNRYLQKVHDENTRFFKSIGIKAEQIFERVDDPGWRDP